MTINVKVSGEENIDWTHVFTYGEELPVPGLKEAKIFGVKHLFTIKRDIVPDGVIYLFAEPEYLGRFYTLQDPTMYVEKKKDILRFSARETLSVTFANLVGCGRIDIV